jgi:hypothetical protein
MSRAHLGGVDLASMARMPRRRSSVVRPTEPPPPAPLAVSASPTAVDDAKDRRTDAVPNAIVDDGRTTSRFGSEPGYDATD